MIKHIKNLSSHLITFVFFVTILSGSAIAGAPPPGVPRKNDCKNSLSIVLAANLGFGRIVATAPGTVIIDTTGSRTVLGPDAAAGVINQAAFDISYGLDACDYYPVRIKVTGLPASLDGPGTSMSADTFTLDSVSPVTLNADYTIPTRVNMGMTLTTGTTVTNGTYTTTVPYTITVDSRNP